jgi:purine-binding chemotaxis protein CheW
VEENEPLRQEAESAAPNEPLIDLLARLDREVVEAWGAGASVVERRDGETGSRYVLFDLGATRYAVAIEGVAETGEVPKWTAVPNVPPWVRGVANLRGEILALIDLRTLLGLPRQEREVSARLVVVRHPEGGGATVGWIVDAIRGMAVITKSEIEEHVASLPKVTSEDRLAGLLAGVCHREGRLIAVLDLNRWFVAPEVRRLTQGSPLAESRVGGSPR